MPPINTHPIADPQYLWFNDWSEGPFPHHEITILVAENPQAAHHYHLLRKPQQTYARVILEHLAFSPS